MILDLVAEHCKILIDDKLFDIMVTDQPDCRLRMEGAINSILPFLFINSNIDIIIGTGYRPGNDRC